MRAQAAAAPKIDAPGAGVLPFYTFQDFQVSDRAVARVNVANGNLFFADTDVLIPGPGVALQLDRYYNSLTGSQTTNGSFALGWGSSIAPWDVGITKTGSTARVFIPGGASATFEWNGSAWASPPGLNATLIENASSSLARFVLTYNQTGERLSFDSSGFLRSNTDRNGVGVQIDANNAGVQAITHTASGRNLIFTYGSTDLIDSVTDSSGRIVSYPKTPNGYLSSSTGGITYGYQGYGLLNSIALGGVTYQISYDSSKRVTSMTVKKSGEPDKTTTFTYNSGTTVVTDPESRAATYTYDSMGRVTATQDALGRSRAQQWTANSDVAQSTDAIGTGTTTYAYDTSGNRTGVSLPTGAAASALYATGVNCTAPNTGTAFQAKCSTDDAGNKKQYQYDAAGNITKQTNTTGASPVTEFERTYGTCGGEAGQICTAKDGNGKVTSYAYNAAGDLTTVTPPSPLGTTSYSYDSLGRITSVTDGNGDATAYQYDVRDRILVTTADDGSTVTSTYFPAGTQHTRTDSAGGSVTYAYNSQNRLTQQTGPTAGATQTYSYDKTGNLLASTDASGTFTYSYDAANQLVKLAEPGGACPSTGNAAANSGCVQFEYNANALETKRTTPGGATTVTARDASGRPTRITAKTGAGATVVDIGYSYTPVGGTGDRANIQSRTAFAEQGVTAGAITGYSYDSRNRLTLAQEKSGTTISASWAYAYDNAGNRIEQVRSGSTGAAAGTIDYTYNAANQITSATGQSTTWTYDAAGNQTRNGLTGIYSTFGQRAEQASTGGVTADYFGIGNTDRISSGSSTFTSSALGLTQKTTSGTAQNYTRTAEGAAVGFKATNRWYYILDHLGSVVGIFSATGTYSGGYSYSPYGEARSTGTASAVATNPLRYISGYHDGSGIYKLGARYYDTSLGRFTQMDPTGQESHPYSYAQSNPIAFTDPSGTSAFTILFDLALTAINAISDGQDLGDALAGAISPEEALALAWGAGGEALCFAGAAVTGAATVTSGAAGGIAVGLFCTVVGVTVTAVLGG